MNTSFIKQGWSDKFGGIVHFPYSLCVFRNAHPAMGTASTDQDAWGHKALGSGGIETHSDKRHSTTKNGILQLKEPSCPLSTNLSAASGMRKGFPQATWFGDHEAVMPTSKAEVLKGTQSKTANPPKLLKCGMNTCSNSSSDVCLEVISLSVYFFFVCLFLTYKVLSSQALTQFVKRTEYTAAENNQIQR